MKVLLTGGAGYLGSVLTRRLLDEDYDVTVLDNFLYGRESLEAISSNKRLELIQGDIRDMTTVTKILEGVDCLIHLASIVGDQASNLEPRTTIEINYLATKNLAELCSMYKIRFVFASTCSVYGAQPEKIITESSETKPIDLYGETKIKSEKAIVSTDNLHYNILRMGTLFGLSPRMRFDLVANLFIAKALSNETLTVFGGEQYRPFLHVADAADGIASCIEKNSEGIFNLAQGNYKIIDIAKIVENVLGANVEISEKIVDKRDYRVSWDKARKLLDFDPKRTIDFSIKEISEAFNRGTIKSYKLPIYSNFESLFTSRDTQAKVYTQGPIFNNKQSSRKVMVTGVTGKLGREVVKIFPYYIAPAHSDLELSDRNSVFEFIKKNRPDTIIHTAALTGVKDCDDNKEKAWKSNVIGTQNIVEACIEYNPAVYFVYVSTACVFDGHKGSYNENDIPHPENFYALTKLLGEFVVKRLSKWLIIRTNFVAKEPWKYPKAFSDRFGTYLFADDVAKGIKDVLNEGKTGIIHITGDKKMSMYDLARLVTKDVQPMTLESYRGPSLTIDMTLDTIRWKRYSISMQ